MTEEGNAMSGTSKADPKTHAQRRFKEVLPKTEAHLKEKASLESEAGKQKKAPNKEQVRRNDRMSSWKR
jgi:hypothetical protein